MNPLRIRGFIVAALTPMKADGALDLDRVGPLLDHYERTGIAGLYVTGSTGEGVSLSSEERRETVAAFIGAARDRFPVIVQVGHNSLREARQLAEYAQSAGADAISATPPSYFKPATAAELVDCLKEITAGAPELPFYYYHIPMMTGVNVSMPEFLRLGKRALPTLMGLKFTSADLHDLQACLELDDGHFEAFSGRDEMLLGALAHGVSGAVGSTYNIAAPLYQRLRQAFEAGDIDTARRCQSRSIRFIELLRGYRLFSAQKAVMKLLGVDCGPPRLPHVGLNDDELAALKVDLEGIGFFDWATVESGSR